MSRNKTASVIVATAAVASAGLPGWSQTGSDPGLQAPRAELDALPGWTVMIGEATMELVVLPGLPDDQLPAIRKWAGDSARAVAAYLGKFPVPRLRIFVVSVPGAAIHGTTWGIPSAATRITLGRRASPDEIMRSWVLTHEMVHLGFPQLARQHLWLEEGLATYVEPIARAQAGLVPAESVWRQFLGSMPQGLPKVGDQGLDNTHTWGRTYWGGALFYLLADIEIRCQTDGRYSLRDALRAVVAAGGNQEVEWSLRDVLDVADRATGARVLSDLYQRMSAAPVHTDLDDMWKRLGVSVSGGDLVFDDSAPLGKIRRAITEAQDG